MAHLAGKPLTSNGFGLMRYTMPASPVPDTIAFPVFKAALSCGANVWAGADYYGTPQANTLHLLSRYFTVYPSDASKVTLCIKGGVVDISTMDCSAEKMRCSVDDCNRILDGKKTIDFFGPSRVDPKVPIEKTVEALGELVKEGKIGGILLSEVSAETIRRAVKVHQIAVVEAEVSLWARDIFQNGVAETCKELGIVVLAYSPLGRGMLAGKFGNLEDVAKGEYHSYFPRFQGKNFEHNLKLVKEIEKLAKDKGCTTPQLALAWIKGMSGNRNMPIIVHIAGARSEQRVRENCEDVLLTAKEMMEINATLDRFPIAGGRYPPQAEKHLEY